LSAKVVSGRQAAAVMCGSRGKLIGRAFGILLVLASVTTAWAEQPANLFLTSVPIGAQLRTRGAPAGGKTPLLLRGLDPGTYRFEVRKEGYLARNVEIVLGPGQTSVLEIDLVEQGISSTFPEDDSIVVLNREEKAGERIFYFEQGSFTISREQGRVYVDPLFPQQRLIDGLHVAIPIMLLFSGLLTADAVLTPSDSEWPIPPAVLAAHGVTLSMIGVDIALNVKKRKQLRAYSFSTRGQEQTLASARRLYAESEQDLEDGSLSKAMSGYTRLVSSFPDSPLVPQALYRMAGIHYLRGENDSAAALYRLIVREYPVADLYDKCQKTLADLLVQSGRYEESIEHLDGMVYLDPLYSRGEIEAYRTKILEQRKKTNPVLAPGAEDQSSR
jgi:hypothetical protein